MIPRTCEVCGSPFAAEANEIARGWGRFCCRFCAYVAQLTNPEERFWANVRKTDTCWLWTAAVDKGGYGKFYADKKHIRAHRFSYILHFGSIASGAFICHHCDNPSCVRPDHLFLGTATDNNRDASLKGRSRSCAMVHPELMPRGQQHGRARLTNMQIQEIRRRYTTERVSQQQLASEYGVCQTTISRIILKKNWQHVPTD